MSSVPGYYDRVKTPVARLHWPSSFEPRGDNYHFTGQKHLLLDLVQ